MDDKPNYELRAILDRKPPSDPLTIEEVRELKKIESERVNGIIQRGVRPEDQSKVWNQLFAEGLRLPANRPRPLVYVTGFTALNIPNDKGEAPDWHSHVLTDRERWLWSGIQIESTAHLLGCDGVYDATEKLLRYASDTPAGTLAASYDRAVFDLLYHFSKIGQPVPNLQYRDIDHAINAGQIRDWIEAIDLPEDQKARMRAWF